MAIDISKIFQKLRGLLFIGCVIGNMLVGFMFNNFIDSAASNIVSIIMTTVVILDMRCRPIYTYIAISIARIMHIVGNDIGRFRLVIAVAPCAFSTATHATSCSTFSVAKNFAPYLLKVFVVISIAFVRNDAPMYPTRKSSIPPSMCPSISGSHDELIVDAFPIPIPASISDTDIATPNHIIAFVNKFVRFFILFPFIFCIIIFFGFYYYILLASIKI